MKAYYRSQKKELEKLIKKSENWHDTDRLTAQEMLIVDQLANIIDEHGKEIAFRIAKDLSKYIKDVTFEAGGKNETHR
jgi:TFIIF-interacting CTD phosphatase-like protein